MCGQDTSTHRPTYDLRGLDEAEAARRLTVYGPNELVERARRSRWQIVWEQLTSIKVLILIVAAAISTVLGDLDEAIVVLAIVILNVALGFTQEYRAERAIAALKRLAVPFVQVRRAGAGASSPQTISWRRQGCASWASPFARCTRWTARMRWSAT